MKSFLVVTITCPDRPGIVERITEVVANFGGNWEESRFARLGGDFAGIVMLSTASASVEALRAALVALSNSEMTVAIKTTSPKSLAMHEGHVLYTLRLEGADHEGIVHDVSAYLAQQGINVETMDTKIAAAPMSATPLFQMVAQLDVPSSQTLDDLRNNLQMIGDRLGVDITISPA